MNPANLPQTCGNCHGEREQELAQVKIHVLDAKTTNYAAYVVQNFYAYLIVIVIGSFVIYILADMKIKVEARKGTSEIRSH